MGEIKSVKVDNWGVFFLQKLQNFFNKTDYCDLTLQFNDNSQLKVHRLVLSACTDYFNVLEQTCEMIEDILVMPPGLQADVIVPIVNFMYTGTLEFEISMYARLLKTARDMNMTVLLKLLEAHRRAVETARSPQFKRQPKSFPPRILNTPIKLERPYTVDQRRVPVSAHQLKTLQIKPIGSTTTTYYPASTEPTKVVPKYTQYGQTPVKGPSRFECNDEITLPPDSFEQFDSISYESKPLITANQVLDDYDALIPVQDTSSTFEQLRKSYTGNKRPASSVSSFESPPEKKPNIQDVKEYAEQQRMRKQIAAEYDDDNEYDEVLDDEFHNDDDDDDYVPPVHLQKQIKKTGTTTTTTPVVIRQEKDQKPTIVVKDTIGSNVNHAKIISEVLKKYPHLVKNNKNIKLKIMAKSATSSSQQQSIVIKQEPEFEQTSGIQAQKVARSITVNIPKGINIQTTQAARKPAQIQKTTQAATKPAAGMSLLKPLPQTNTPRRIDSKTMHALIALGAENKTGPWLCLKCGVNGRPISIPSYRGFRRHLINTHNEKIDSRLCEHCGWRSSNNLELYHHIKVQHDISPPAGYYFPPCSYCSVITISKAALEQHIKDEHPEKLTGQQLCMYCDAMFKDEDELYTHMQNQHKEQAQKDGLLDYTDDEEAYYSSEAGEQSSEKIKILSNITISPQANLKPGTKISLGKGTQSARSLNTVATGIAASLGLIDTSESQEIQYLEESDFIGSGNGGGTEPKFVNADGHIMELTAEQREEIMSQLESQHQGGVLMVLNQETFETSLDESGQTTKVESTERLLLQLAHEERSSDDKKTSKIAGSERIDEESDDSQASADHATKSKEDGGEKNDAKDTKKNEEVSDDGKDNEQLETEEKDDEEQKTAKIEKAKEKLKLLTGDWSDDEDEEEKPSVADKDKNTNTVQFLKSVDEKEDSRKSPTDKADSIDREVIFETVTGDENDTTAEDLETSKEAATESSEKDELVVKDDSETEEKPEDIATDKSVFDDVGKREAGEEVAAAGNDNKDQTDDNAHKQEEEKVTDKEQVSINANEKVGKEEKQNEEKSTEDKEAKSKKELNADGDSDKEAKKEGGDHIRSLINDWGDDEEDEDL